MQAISYAIEEGLKKKGERALGVEGVSGGKWALMDYNDVVVHIFLEHVRGYYDLEGLWAEAPSVEVKDKIKKAVSKAVSAEKPKPSPRARAKKTAGGK